MEDGKLYPVYTLKNECHDCYKCIRECHIKAIKIKNGSASVINDKCIACGHCVRVCPQNAKRVRNDINAVKTLFLQNKDVYVSLAPSWAGVYSIPKEKMISALKKLGFKGVSETALGAQEVSIQCAKILNNAESGLFISSACPVIDDYIRLYKSEFAPNITPLGSPAMTHAKLLKQVYGSSIEVVFIGPCIAKKNEADNHPELIRAALTFEELNYWIKDEFIDIETIEADESCRFVPESSYEGALYPLEGGMIETIKRAGVKDKNTAFVCVSSLEAFDSALNGLEPSKIKDKIFVEALGCTGGCINGPCLSSGKSRIMITSDIYHKTRYRDTVPDEPKAVVNKEYIPAPAVRKEYSFEQITEALLKISKHSEEDELNCSGCGYSSCREFVNALISGDAEPSMCVSYMRKIAVRKAAAMLRNMPFAIVMADENMNVAETNDAFMKMFCSSMEEVFGENGIQGAAIDRIVPFGGLFKSVLENGSDIHKEHYSIDGRLYDIRIFSIEKGSLAGAVISDVTKSELDRSKIAARAKEVITKNIAAVQEIAGLLGEHMAETELLLGSIAEGFDSSADGDKKYNVH